MFPQYVGTVPLASFPENILSSPLACISWDYMKFPHFFKFIIVCICYFLNFYFIKNCVYVLLCTHKPVRE